MAIKIIVLIAGLIIKVFETFLNSEVMMNECYLAASSSRIVLTALKEITIEILLKSRMNNFKEEFKYCNINMQSRCVTPLRSTIFNTTSNNFTLLLNRRNMAQKLTIKMVKEQKKKNRWVHSMKSKNDDKDASAWTGEFCK